MRQTEAQDTSHADLADPKILNQIIWFSVRGKSPMPAVARLPIFDVMRLGLVKDEELAQNENVDDRE
jgi:hypothetical protein